MTSPDAVAWLRAQIGEKLTAARGLACTGTGHWAATENGDYDWTVHDAIDVMPKQNAVTDCWGEAVALFIADNDPQDVIARCEAELAILDECELLGMVGIAFPGEAGPESAEKISRLVASSYRRRPGYAEHWGSGD